MLRQSWRRFASTTSSASAASAAAAASGPDLQHFINEAIEKSPEMKLNTVKQRRKKDIAKPKWLKVEAADSENYTRLRSTVRELGLSTVCEEARCPNIGECWGGRDGTATATIMLMGDTCTRGCRFCSVKTSQSPGALDANEPSKVAEAIRSWGLDYVVLTSVDRDDLPDHGSQHIAECIRRLKRQLPSGHSGKVPLVECLSPDFGGDFERVAVVANSGLDVFAHNIETVAELTPFVRDRRASYLQSLSVLQYVKTVQPSLVTKSSIMLGVGERDDQLRTAMKDLLNAGVEVLTLGQYLRPTRRHMKVANYVEPQKFEEWKHVAEDMGFKYCASGPLVRSSYKAGEAFLSKFLNDRNTSASSQS